MPLVRDRPKDLIKSGGEWISSVDLENAISGLPAGPGPPRAVTWPQAFSTDNLLPISLLHGAAGA
jgi:acyl-CoA synthetase (AMP-forming)/AMP-acid ligase II